MFFALFTNFDTFTFGQLGSGLEYREIKNFTSYKQFIFPFFMLLPFMEYQVMLTKNCEKSQFLQKLNYKMKTN